jgi:hypothetical protein
MIITCIFLLQKTPITERKLAFFLWGASSGIPRIACVFLLSNKLIIIQITEYLKSPHQYENDTPLDKTSVTYFDDLTCYSQSVSTLAPLICFLFDHLVIQVTVARILCSRKELPIYFSLLCSNVSTCSTI